MIELEVPGISCNHCVARVKQALQAVDPHAQVDVDLQRKTVRVSSREGRGALIAALDAAGYPVR